jgi:Tol biopolymer transport system component
VKRLTVLLAALALALPASAGRLPILASQDLWPVFSPDGRHVAFTVDVNGQGRVLALDVVDVRTKQVVRVGTASAQLSPTWSSDGRLAYASGGVLRKANARGTGKYLYPSQHPAFAPAWRPHSEQVAYLTSQGAQNLDLWVGQTLWAKGVIGKPAWSPDGTQLAFQRDGSLWVASQPLVQEQLATTKGEPGAPAWSPDGSRIAFAAGGAVYVVPADASAPPRQVAGPFATVGPLAWAPAGDLIAYSVPRGLETTTPSEPPRSQLLVAAALGGASFDPSDPQGRILAYAGPLPSCPGHAGIRLYGQRVLAGSCRIAGTAAADVIEGTASFNDIVVAGGGDDRIRVADGHTDRVDCVPGRDTVWADRSDRLSHCEVAHR